MIYLLSEQRLKKDFLNDNIASELILPSIQTAQDIYLKQTLGSALYDIICELVENNSVVEPYKTLLDDYIIIYLEYLAMAELCVPSSFKIGNIGVAQAYDNNVNTQSIQNVKYLESFYKQKASTYENRLVTYIQQNINYFPEYLATNEVVTAKESTLQTGLFLGGTKTKTTKRTTTNKNSLVGAVRYDVQQNLSEQEKQQARENIGVSANGDIDVDLENYYTKDEVYNKNQVDTKLIPYITTNEVNLRLNSYYDKSQTDTAIQNAIDNIDIPDVDLSNYYDKNTVNNLLDNLPIPEYTSELIKDDVYTKNEVDERIANVSSGGSVDLSNYYTKQETYSKEEVNDLVANSGGSDSPSNATIVDIMSLTYEEQVELIDFVFDNNRFPDVNTLYTYQGYVLNNLTIYSEWWDEALNQRYVVFSLYDYPKSYEIRFITYQWNEGKIYNDITEKDSWYSLVTNGEVDDKLNTLSNGLVLDLNQYDNDELLSVYYKIKNGQTYTDKPITYRGKFINNVTIEGEKVRFWHYAITTDSNTINSDKTFYVDVELYDVEMGLVSAIYNEIGDCTVIGGNSGGSDSNMPIVDIMSLPYDKQLEIIDFVIDNNIFPNINTLYTYQGYVLNNLEHYSAFWNEENGERYIVFSLYDYPKSYDIRFITYEWDDGVIYNDINEKQESEKLVRKGETYNRQEIENLVANSGGGSSDYNTLENRPTTNIANWTYEQMNNLYDIVQNYGSLTEELSFNGLYLNDLEVLYGVGDLNGNDEINRLEFWNRKYGTPYAIRIFIDFVNSIWWWDRNELDETERLLSEYQMQEIYYTKSEIDTQIAEINATLGDINNILNEI